jgi:hypothetical protein
MSDYATNQALRISALAVYLFSTQSPSSGMMSSPLLKLLHGNLKNHLRLLLSDMRGVGHYDARRLRQDMVTGLCPDLCRCILRHPQEGTVYMEIRLVRSGHFLPPIFNCGIILFAETSSTGQMDRFHGNSIGWTGSHDVLGRSVETTEELFQDSCARSLEFQLLINALTGEVKLHLIWTVTRQIRTYAKRAALI